MFSEDSKRYGVRYGSFFAAAMVEKRDSIEEWSRSVKRALEGSVTQRASGELERRNS
jgi:hypothetical protein